MRDLVEKYQYYFSESIKLQKLVNEQAAYIAKLEEVLAALSEDYATPERARELDADVAAADDAYKARATELERGPKKGKAKRTWDQLTPEEQQELLRLHDIRKTTVGRREHELNHPTKLYGPGGTIIGTVSPKTT